MKILERKLAWLTRTHYYLPTSVRTKSRVPDSTFQKCENLHSQFQHTAGLGAKELRFAFGTLRVKNASFSHFQ